MSARKKVSESPASSLAERISAYKTAVAALDKECGVIVRGLERVLREEAIPLVQRHLPEGYKVADTRITSEVPGNSIDRYFTSILIVNYHGSPISGPEEIFLRSVYLAVVSELEKLSKKYGVGPICIQGEVLEIG